MPLRRLALPLFLALAIAGCLPISAPPPQGLQPPTPALAAAAGPGSSGLNDPLFPLLGNGGYDVQHYALDLDVHVPSNTITATATIVATATQNLSAFNLDFSGLTVTEITVNDLAAVHTRSDPEMTVVPALPLMEGSLFTTTVSYHGTPRPLRDPAIGFAELGWNHAGNLIYVVSEPSGAMTWYPNNNHPSDKATYTMRVTVDKPYTVAANGELVKIEEQDGRRATYTWTMDAPMASYLATLVIGDLVRVDNERSGQVRIRNYFPTEDANRLAIQFSVTAEMIDYYSAILGDYPFETYGVAVLPFHLGYALETQTLSIFGNDGGMEGVIAHELMHQWLGNHVTPATWQDIWLNEGFATYFQRLWLDHKLGRGFLDTGMVSYYKLLKAGHAGPPGAVGAHDMFSSTVYERGAWTLHALRLQVGDEAFFRIIREYYRRHAGGNVSTAGFIAVANEVSGQDLTEFLNNWIYGPELPPIPEETITDTEGN